jgi:hypothetical protein
MEVNVVEAANLPSRPVMAIHAGSVRRQAKLEVNSPFVIPHPGAQCGSMEVTVFHQIASQVLPCENTSESFCSIPVSGRDGGSSMVQLRVRRGEAALAAMSTDNVKKPGSAEDSITMTRDYLENHQLQQCIQNLIQDVLRVQPNNPYQYMLEQLRKEKGNRGGESAQAKSEAKEPLAPRPPDKPKPENGFRGRSMPSPSKASTTTDAPPPGSDYANPAARYSVMLMLNSEACRKVAEESLRDEVRKEVAANMGSLASNAIKDKLVSQASRSDSSERRSIATLPNPASLDPSLFHRALVKWAAHLSFRGACRINGYSSEVSKATDATESNQALPTPYVFLEAGTGWGQWLT